MMDSRIYFLLFFMFFNFSCTKKHDKTEQFYSDKELTLMMETTGAILDRELTVAIQFSDYSPGVDRENSKGLVYQRLSFYAIKFSTESSAKEEALRLNQYYARNWLFDRVAGEPVLEDMLISKFQATNPRNRVQRKSTHLAPNKSEASHH